MPKFNLPFDGTEVSPDKADFSAIHPDKHEIARGYIFPPCDGWPTGYIRQSDIDAIARIHPAGYGLDALEAATNRRSEAKADYEKANDAWLVELRKAYKAGRPARVLAEVAGVSSVRVSQLVGGSRR